MAIIGVILFIVGAVVVAALYAVGFAVLGFGLATLAVFYYLGAFWGVAWRGWCFGERCFSGAQAQKTNKTGTFKQSLLVVKAQKDWKFRQALFGVAVKFVSDD